MDANELASRVAHGMLAAEGTGPAWGIRIEEARSGYARLSMTVRADMLNGFGLCHGGVTFSLADSALAFASNTHGSVTVSIENSITYPAPVHVGDVLTARAEEESSTERLAFYRVTVEDQKGTTVALFRGTVYRTKRPHFPDEIG